MRYAATKGDHMRVAGQQLVTSKLRLAPNVCQRVILADEHGKDLNLGGTERSIRLMLVRDDGMEHSGRDSGG
jgi:hypothetical protein